MLIYRTFLGVNVSNNRRVSKENKKRREKKEFIDNLQKEINKLETEINNVKKTNTKRAIIKNVRICGRKILKWIPLFVTSFIVTVPYFSFVGVPFIRRPITDSAHIKQTYDTLGNFDEIRQFTSFSSTTAYLEMCSKWEKDGDKYIREVRTYYLDSDTVEKCFDVASGNLITDFNGLFNTVPNDISYETSNHLSEEDINQDAFAKLTTYSSDSNQKNVRLTNVGEELGITLGYLLAMFICEFIAIAVTEDFRNKCDSKVRDYKNKYEPIDAEKMKKELVLKKDNFNTLMGE